MRFAGGEPTAALRATADVQTPSFGAHLHADLYLGKAPSAERPAMRFGSDFISGRYNLGPSIKMGQ